MLVSMTVATILLKAVVYMLVDGRIMHIQVSDQYNSEALFQNLIHNLYIPASPSLE